MNVNEFESFETHIAKKYLPNLPKGTVIGNQYEICNPLQRGAGGVGYKVFDRKNTTFRTIKIADTKNMITTQGIKRQFEILKNLPEHPHIVEVVEYNYIYLSNPNGRLQIPFIVMDYIEGNQLDYWISKNLLSLKNSFKIVCQITNALSHIHGFGVYHRDIKVDNIIWSNPFASLIDFDRASFNNEGLSNNTGFFPFIPPDLNLVGISNNDINIDRDIYGLGVTLCLCITGNYPFGRFNNSIDKNNIIVPTLSRNQSHLSEPFINLLKKIIQPKRENRFNNVFQLKTALDTVKYCGLTK